jgi:hypothetical protein
MLPEQRTQRGTRFGFLMGLCVLAVLVVRPRPCGAQDDPPPGSLREAFAQLNAQDEQAAAAGADRAQRATAFATWMQGNDWRLLPLWEQRVLYDRLDPDQIDYPRVSIRWTGTLTPVTTDRYTLVQMRQLGQDPIMKVWVDGNLVLDSSPRDGEEVDNSFTSTPLDLVAGRAVSLQVDFSHDVNHEIAYSMKAPLAVLAWQTGALERSLIPTEVLAPPADAGLGEPGSTGLKGEYFSGSTFDPAQLKTTRLDQGVELAWPWVPIVPVYPVQLAEIRQEVWQKLSTETFLGGLVGAELRQFLDGALWQFSHRLPVSQRRELVQTVLAHPALIEALSPYALGKLMESIYMLPGREHLELLRAWSLARPQPKSEIGFYPGWGEGSYESYNLEYYWLIGHFLQPPYFADVEQLWNEHLRRPDGECNLPLAYATSYTAYLAGQSGQLLQLLEAGAQDEALAGDQRATWFFALAYARGAMVYGEPQPIRGMEYLQEAMLTAESPEYRFWALQEMVARLASLDEEDEVARLLSQYQDEFTSPSQQAAQAAWRQKAQELTSRYAELRQNPPPVPLDEYLAHLKSRLAAAQGRGDEEEVVHYQNLLQAASAILPAP